MSLRVKLPDRFGVLRRENCTSIPPDKVQINYIYTNIDVNNMLNIIYNH